MIPSCRRRRSWGDVVRVPPPSARGRVVLREMRSRAVLLCFRAQRAILDNCFLASPLPVSREGEEEWLTSRAPEEIPLPPSMAALRAEASRIAEGLARRAFDGGGVILDAEVRGVGADEVDFVDVLVEPEPRPPFVAVPPTRSGAARAGPIRSGDVVVRTTEVFVGRRVRLDVVVEARLWGREEEMAARVAFRGASALDLQDEWEARPEGRRPRPPPGEWWSPPLGCPERALDSRVLQAYEETLAETARAKGAPPPRQSRTRRIAARFLRGSVRAVGSGEVVAASSTFPS